MVAKSGIALKSPPVAFKYLVTDALILADAYALSLDAALLGFDQSIVPTEASFSKTVRLVAGVQSEV